MSMQISDTLPLLFVDRIYSVPLLSILAHCMFVLSGLSSTESLWLTAAHRRPRPLPVGELAAAGLHTTPQ